MQNKCKIEQNILGINLVTNKYTSFIVDSLLEEDFTTPQNKEIFNSIKILHSPAKEIDLRTLAEITKQITNTKIEEEYLIEIQENIFDIKDIQTVKNYIALLKEKTQRRKLTELMANTQDLIVKNVTFQEILNNIDKGISAIRSEVDPDDDISQHRTIQDSVSMILNVKNPKKYQIQTYIDSIDSLFNGFKAGTLTVLGAKTGHGKTTFAMNVAVKNAICGTRVLIYSLEMSRAAIGIKMFPIFSSLDQNPERKMSLTELNRKEKTTPEFMDKLTYLADKLYGLQIETDDATNSSSSNIASIIAKIRYSVAVKKTQLVIIDYMQLIEYSSRDFNNRTQALGFISRRLKMLAVELNIPILVLAQLSREADKVEKPRRYHLRESGSIEHDADNILLLHSLEDEPMPVDKMLLIIEKQREGQVGETQILFDKEHSTFLDDI